MIDSELRHLVRTLESDSFNVLARAQYEALLERSGERHRQLTNLASALQKHYEFRTSFLSLIKEYYRLLEQSLFIPRQYLELERESSLITAHQWESVQRISRAVGYH